MTADDRLPSYLLALARQLELLSNYILLSLVLINTRQMLLLRHPTTPHPVLSFENSHLVNLSSGLLSHG